MRLNPGVPDQLQIYLGIRRSLIRHAETEGDFPRQLAKMKLILKALVNERSLSLLPKNFQGTLVGYSLRFGTPPKEVSFDAPQYRLDQITKESPAGTLLFKFDELRDYLMEISSGS